MTYFWMFKIITVSVCAARHRLSRAPPGPSRPRDRATPGSHSNARCPRRKNGRRRRIRRAGGVGRCPPWDGLLGPRERRGPRKGRVSIISGGISPRDFVRDHVLAVSTCMEGVFFRRWNTIIPSGMFSLHPRAGFSSYIQQYV